MPLSGRHGLSYICRRSLFSLNLGFYQLKDRHCSIEDAGCAAALPALSLQHERYKIHFRGKRIAGNGATNANPEKFRERENIAHVDILI